MGELRRITIEIEPLTDAFHEPGGLAMEAEVQRILVELAGVIAERNDIRAMLAKGVRDFNGNTVGAVTFEELLGGGTRSTCTTRSRQPSPRGEELLGGDDE